jgi:hypothetical protein
MLKSSGGREMTAEESKAFWAKYGSQMQPPDGEG